MLAPINVLEFLKLQNVIHVSYVAFPPHVVVCTGPQNSSVGINNDNHSEMCWVTNSRNITRTHNRRFTVGIVLCGPSCFLFPNTKV